MRYLPIIIYTYRACSANGQARFYIDLHQNKIIKSGNLHIFKIITGINFQKAIDFPLFSAL